MRDKKKRDCPSGGKGLRSGYPQGTFGTPVRSCCTTSFRCSRRMPPTKNIYNALALVLRDLMRNKRLEFIAKAKEQQSKQVYYLCMEFHAGRSRTACIIWI